MRLILFGAPGVGKGTQAAIISRALNIPSIATGDILRAAVREGTPLGQTAKEIMARGDLVPDDIIIKIVRDRLKEDDCKNGYILDGVPRTLPQAQALEEHGVVIDNVLSLELTDKILKERLVGRRACEDCSTAYHVTENPPQSEGVCDKCGGKLIQRGDDLPETVEARLNLFHKTTAPLKEYYGKKGMLRSVSNHGTIAQTTKLIFEALGVKQGSGEF